MIELPKKFKLDTQGTDTYLIPVIVIDDRIYLSTNKVSLSGQHYEPLIKKIGNIRESIDHSKKIFKISSVKISLFNQKGFSRIDGKYAERSLADRLFSQDILNKRISIYYKSQSATLLSECLNVYSGYVDAFSESGNTITLEVEDIAERILNKKLPQRFTPTEDNFPEKERNKPIPIVYGYVTCPLVYTSLSPIDADHSGGGTFEYYTGFFDLRVDDKFIKSCVSPKVYKDNIYATIVGEADLFSSHKTDTVFQQTGTTQYEISDDNAIVIARTGNYQMKQGSMLHWASSPITANMVEIEQYSGVSYLGGTHTTNWDYSYNVDSSVIGDDPDDFFGEADIGMYASSSGTSPATSVSGAYFRVTDFGDLPNPVDMSNVWLWGKNRDYFGNGVFDDLGSINNLQFEVADFFKSSDMVTEFSSKYTELTEVEATKVNSWFNLLYNINTKVEYSGNSSMGTVDITGNPAFSEYTHPIINVVFSDGHSELMDHSQLTPTGGVGGYETFQKSNVSTTSSQNRVLTQDIGAKTFSLTGQRWHIINEGEDDESQTLIEFSSNGLGWINTTSLQAYKRAILSDFNNMELYALAEGRVDDIGGRYTGTELTVLSGQSDIAIRQEQGISSRRLSFVSRKKAKAVSPKTIKKINKGGY